MSPVCRRQFLLGAAALVSARFGLAQAPPPGNPFRLGLFPDLHEPFRGWMHEAMQSVGWRQASDYAFVESGEEYGEPTAAVAQRLIGRKVDLVLVNSTAHALVAHRLTSRLPIVMWGSGYPVEAGVAISLARPGRNVTGVSAYAGTGIWGKLLQLLHEARPGIRRIGVAWGYVPPTFPKEEIEPCYRELRQSANALGVALHIEEIANPGGLQAGLGAIDAARPEALIITAGPGFHAERHRVVQFAVSKRIPTAVDWRWPPGADAQPLLTYGAVFPALMRQAASYVRRILRDRAKPGDLPIQQPSKFEFVINRRTAKAIGLAIPQSLLLRADEIIE